MEFVSGALPSPDLFKHLIGKPQDEVREQIRQAGYISRVVSVDGVHSIITMELRTNRANLFVDQGLVTKITFG